jgi:hypothetical protein
MARLSKVIRIVKHCLQFEKRGDLSEDGVKK